MFTKLILLFGVVVIAMAAPTANQPPQLLLEPVDATSEWNNWKVKHQKQYGNEEEEANRFNIFKENLKKITEHNKKYETGEVTWSQGLNQFADLTQEEFAKSHLRGILPKPAGSTGLN